MDIGCPYILLTYYRYNGLIPFRSFQRGDHKMAKPMFWKSVPIAAVLVILVPIAIIGAMQLMYRILVWPFSLVGVSEGTWPIVVTQMSVTFAMVIALVALIIYLRDDFRYVEAKIDTVGAATRSFDAGREYESERIANAVGTDEEEVPKTNATS